MATRPSFTVTEVPQELVAALNLTDGKRYTVQNIGAEPIIFAQRDAAPADLATLLVDKGHILASAGVATSPKDTPSTAHFDVTGDLLYAWTVGGADGELVVSDAL